MGVAQQTNKYGTAWRPLLFKSPEELQKKIDEYFAKCTDDKWNEPVTITWLALHLNTDRLTLMHYQERPDFINTIKNAKLRVEQAYEKRLIKRWSRWDIFALKNFNWVDKQEIEQKTELSWMLETIDISKMTSEERLEYIKNKCK